LSTPNCYSTLFDLLLPPPGDNEQFIFIPA
jgi:hypothetical protein